MKKLSIKKTTIRHLTGAELGSAHGGFVATDGQTQSCANTCGCPVNQPPAPSGHYTCVVSCILCGTLP